MRQHVTRSGLAFTGATVLVGLAAFASANNLLFLLLAAMLSTFLISGFVSRLGLAGLELELLLPDRVSAREPVSGSLVLRNTKRLLASFSIRLQGQVDSGLHEPLYFPLIPSRQAMQVRAKFRFPKRGRQTEKHFEVSSRFPFGFTERNVPVTVRQEVLVYPCLTPVPELQSLLDGLEEQAIAAQRGRGHDFYRIRPYEYTESARHVDWKISAHTGDLQVREYAQEQELPITLFLDLDTDDEQWFETAVECCAYLTWTLAQRGAPVRWRTQRTEATALSADGAHTILEALALVAPQFGAKPVVPHADSDFQIVFSTSPERLAAHGWHRAHMVSPDSVRGSGADASSPAHGS